MITKVVLNMTPEEIEKWLESTSCGFIDRRGKPLNNSEANKLFADFEYRKVAKDEIVIDGHKIEISTVFLGMEHIGGAYETMIFADKTKVPVAFKYDQWQHRWKNAAQASKAHIRIVEALKNGEDLPFEDTNIFTQFFGDILRQEQEGEEWKDGNNKSSD